MWILPTLPPLRAAENWPWGPYAVCQALLLWNDFYANICLLTDVLLSPISKGFADHAPASLWIEMALAAMNGIVTFIHSVLL